MGRALHAVNGFCVGVQVPLGGQGLFLFTLTLEGLIFLRLLGPKTRLYKAFWAQRPYYIRLLGYVDAKG